MEGGNEIVFGDCRDSMRKMADSGLIAQACVTSPPYFGLRDYGHAGQFGLEATPDDYIANMVKVFRAVRDVLADDGTLWLNIGDSYARNPTKGGSGPGGKNREWYGDAYPDRSGRSEDRERVDLATHGIKEKDLIGIPWMLAFALRADGWYLRQEIIWHKPNAMPESVRDRCTKAHESLFLFAKSERYYFDSAAMQEPAISGATGNAATFKRVGSKREQTIPGQGYGTHRTERAEVAYNETRNRRSVWTVPTRPYKGAHFATFPPALIEPCILAGSRPGDIVLDPFMGSGTTAEVAIKTDRKYIGCELNTKYKSLQDARIDAAKAFVDDRDIPKQTDLFAKFTAEEAA